MCASNDRKWAVCACCVVVQVAEIDESAAGRQLVEAKRLEAGTGSFGGGGQAGRAGADHDDVEGWGSHASHQPVSAAKFKRL